MQHKTSFRIGKLFNKAISRAGLVDMPVSVLRARYETPHSRYLNLHGMRIHYTDQGQGPALVLLHGIFASLHTWEGWAKELSSHYRIICLDLPGFGLTGRQPQRRYHPTDYVSFLESFRVALNLPSFHLAGNSLGGIIAWQYAKHHPEQVEKLVLLNPGGYKHPADGILRLVASPLVMQLSRYVFPRLLMKMGLREVYGDPARMRPGTHRRYHELILHPGNRQAMADVARTLTTLTTLGSLEKDIPHVTAPTLLMWGDQDRWIPVTHISRWKADLPQLQVKVYAGVGHVPMEEIPERTAVDVHEFLDSTVGIG